MALSDSVIKNIGSYNRLRLTWSATQSESNNTSTITVRLYWEATRSGVGPVSSSSSRTASIRIDGVTNSNTTTAGLSSGGSKLINSYTRTVSHDSQGRLNASISGTFDLSGVYISGTNYGSQTISTTANLNDIPRTSSISSNANWTAGSNKSVSINRASSSFTHTVRFYVGGKYIMSETNVGTSVTSNFSTADNTAIFDQLNGAASMGSEIRVLTYSGSTLIGQASKFGTVTAPSASSLTRFNGEVPTHNNPKDHWTDQTFTFPITRANSSFTHTVRVSVEGTLIKTLTGVGTSVSWTPTTAEKTAMHNKMLTKSVSTGNVEIITYYNGEQVRSPDNNTLYFYIRNAEPTFSSSYLTYRDTNTATVAITGNNAIMIQGRSKLSVILTGSASGREGASIAKYDVSINGVTKSSTSIGTFVFNEISASGQLALSVKVTDSRGLTTTVTKTVTVWAYSPPRLTVSAERLGGFEAQTTVEVTGSLTALSGNKNYVRTARAYYVNKGTGATAGTTNLSVSGYPTFSATPIVYTLNNQTAYDVVVTVEDVLSTVVHTVSVEIGRPILFLDSEKGSVGIGDFPVADNQLFVNAQLKFGSSSWNNTYGGTASIDLNDSDMVGIDGLYFNDTSTGGGEGINFLKTGRNAGSFNDADYDNFRILDGKVYLNDGGIRTPSLDVDGLVTIGNSSSYRDGWMGYPNSDDERFRIRSNTTDVIVDGRGTELFVGSDGSGSRIWSTAFHSRTYSLSPNAVITSVGIMGRSTSATKYKLNIESFDADDLAERLLYIQPKSWHDKASSEAFADQMTKLYNGESIEDSEVPFLERHFGLIAEDLVDLGLEMFVQYGEPDEKGNREVEGIEYDRLWTILIPYIRKLSARVAKLEQKQIGGE